MTINNKKILIIVMSVSLFLLICILLYFTFLKSNTNNLDLESYSLTIPSKTTEIPLTNNFEVRKPNIDIHLLFFGDTALLEPQGTLIIEDPLYSPFMNVLEAFNRYDYIVGSLEVPIDGDAVGTPQIGKNYTFTTPKESVRVYKEAGIDAFAYSSNHTKDYGAASVTHTIELLKAEGIQTFGSGANNNEAYTPLYVTVKDTKFAFVAYNCMEWAFNHATDYEAGTASFVEWRVRQVIEEANQNADIVIVFSHWGNEHTTELDHEWQIKWADIYTSAGADIVIGAHPHIIQESAIVNGKPVYYSVGNFIFPGMGFDPNSLKSLAIEIVVKDKNISEVIEHKVTMTNEGIPTILN
jgi:poly-gamma-glutamate synthesis protein (capsule biosynthesis protein)